MPLSTLYSPNSLSERVVSLGQEIAERLPPGPIVVVGVLKGAFVFMADLVRAIPRELTCDFVSVSSYGAGNASSGQPALQKDLSTDIQGKYVLLVEDIVDTGLTARFLLERFKGYQPSGLYLTALLNKPSRRRVEVTPDFIGFTIDDVFVVGYGLDFGERYRNLPYIGVLDENPCNRG